jgi:hypothetical protein
MSQNIPDSRDSAKNNPFNLFHLWAHFFCFFPNLYSVSGPAWVCVLYSIIALTLERISFALRTIQSGPFPVFCLCPLRRIVSGLHVVCCAGCYPASRVTGDRVTAVFINSHTRGCVCFTERVSPRHPRHPLPSILLLAFISSASRSLTIHPLAKIQHFLDICHY